MPHRVRVEDLFEALQTSLQLKLLGGESGLKQALLGDDTDPARYIIAGPLNYIHPNRIQVIGNAEVTYLQEPDRDYQRALQRLFELENTRVVILVDGVPLLPQLVEHANANDVALFSSPLPDKAVLDHLQHFASLHLSDKTILHGVFLEVLGMGVLLTGDPAVGKSELALELISRGNRLIADDAPEFTRIAPDIVSGACPHLLREFLEVRGLGVINIRAMFGDNSIKHNKYLRLIVHLKRMNDEQITAMERLHPQAGSREILGVVIPKVTIPVAPGRNLAILVEAAVRNHLLRLKGYDATAMFIERQQSALLAED
jgi:HPr kinase/phosphorylase